MSGLAAAFERARAEGRTALIPYVMANYPEPGGAEPLAEALARGGADLIEVGMPFSDPLADGPTVQRAGARSLEHGTTVADCISTAGAVRERTGLPTVLMGYINPILRYGVERFCADAAGAGVSGLILPDLPPEEAEEVRAAAGGQRLEIIFLVAPTSTEDRLAKAAAVAGGFVYCVSLSGVTGARSALAEGLEAFLARVRRHTDLPLAVGFGISTPEHVRRVGAFADGVVVASALIDLVERTAPAGRLDAMEAYTAGLRGATVRDSAAGAGVPVEAGRVS